VRLNRSFPLAAVVALVVTVVLGGSAAYTVRPGDTLSGIASRLGVSVADLARANDITDPDRVFAGRALTVPGSSTPTRTHVVTAGENLTTIARRYGATVGALAAANHLDPRRVLPIGARLVLPASGAARGGGGRGYPLRLAASPSRLALVPHFRHWAAANRLPADLLMATTWLESGWQNHVVSSVGAVGIGQLMPSTVRFVRSELIGIDTLDPRVPEHNIRMSARYLRWLLQLTRGEVRTALAYYYQGPRSVWTKGPLPVTVAYVDTVLALRRRFA
jgi:LysM repeat protein